MFRKKLSISMSAEGCNLKAYRTNQPVHHASGYSNTSESLLARLAGTTGGANGPVNFAYSLKEILTAMLSLERLASAKCTKMFIHDDY